MEGQTALNSHLRPMRMRKHLNVICKREASPDSGLNRNRWHALLIGVRIGCICRAVSNGMRASVKEDEVCSIHTVCSVSMRHVSV